MSGIYIASKTRHADKWRTVATKYPINSTWIYEAEPGQTKDFDDLWRRCIHEASTADALIIYREGEEVLKGAWVELGAALACGVPVFAVGIDDFTVGQDSRIQHFHNFFFALEEAMKKIKENNHV